MPPKQTSGIQTPDGWTRSEDGQRLVRSVKTKDFVDAVRIIQAVAEVAEALEHHPDLHLERWNHLRIETYSHDVGRLTERDVGLAERINDVLGAGGA